MSAALTLSEPAVRIAAPVRLAVEVVRRIETARVFAAASGEQSDGAGHERNEDRRKHESLHGLLPWQVDTKGVLKSPSDLRGTRAWNVHILLSKA